MRNTFLGYYRPTDDEFTELWQNCLFVLDTNVLLNLYRYSSDTSNALTDILAKISDRLWLPHQVALEYQDNRLGIISGQEKLYQEIPDILENAQKKLKDSLRREHLSIDVESLLDIVETAFAGITDELEKHKVQHPDLFNNDHIRNAITSLFEGKVGSPYPPDKLAEIYRGGEARYKSDVPPGYKDIKEKQGKTKRYGNLIIKNEYGDLILWRQIIDKAKDQKKPIILVSDEKKEDWWWEAKGKTIGPRPELITEMMNEANVLFYMYRMDRFVSYARDYLEIPVAQEVVDEVQEIAEERRSWKDEAINALVSLGGDAALVEIYEYIENTTSRELSKTWRATIRRTLQTYCSDTETYEGGEDLFQHLGRGRWGLRSEDVEQDDNKAGDEGESSSEYK